MIRRPRSGFRTSPLIWPLKGHYGVVAPHLMPCELFLNNVTKLVLQERAATETMMSHHEREHILAHNMETAQRLFTLLQSDGIAVSANRAPNPRC